MKIKTFCDVYMAYVGILNWWVDFGPERPDFSSDLAYDLLVDSFLQFNETQSAWYKWSNGEGKFCFVKN